MVQIFTTNGSWTVPVGCTSVFVECYGAGGGGGTRTTAATNRAGGAGRQGAIKLTWQQGDFLQFITN